MALPATLVSVKGHVLLVFALAAALAGCGGSGSGSSSSGSGGNTASLVAKVDNADAKVDGGSVVGTAEVTEGGRRASASPSATASSTRSPARAPRRTRS